MAPTVERGPGSTARRVPPAVIVDVVLPELDVAADLVRRQFLGIDQGIELSERDAQLASGFTGPDVGLFVGDDAFHAIRRQPRRPSQSPHSLWTTLPTRSYTVVILLVEMAVRR